MSQKLQQQQNLSLNAHVRQSLSVLALSPDRLLEEITRFAEANPALIVHDAPSTPRLTSPSSSYTNEIPPWENIAQGQTLQQVLTLQWALEAHNQTEQAIGNQIISQLDDRGFLKAQLPLSLAPIVQKLQRLEPIGCATANYLESLLVQLQAQNLALDLAPAELEMGLKTLQAKQTDKALRAFHCSTAQELQHFMRVLKGLSPYPGLKYQSTPKPYISSEFKISYQDDALVIQPLQNYAQRLSVDPAFAELARKTDASGQHAKEQVMQASGFIKMIYARESTLYRLAQYMAEYQKAFFRSGWLFLRPLRQKDLAQALHLHEATISRALRDKYIDTNFGLIKMQNLCSPGLATIQGKVSKTRLKQLLAQWLAQQNPRPSDQKLCERFRSLGYTISRRTVTKYRNELEKL